MPFSLKDFNLKPNALYRVSLVLNQGDKEVDTLRSFYSKTPKFFTQNLSDFVSYPFVKTGVVTTPAVPDRTVGETTVYLEVDKVKWTIKGIKKFKEPVYTFKVTVKRFGSGKKAKVVNLPATNFVLHRTSKDGWRNKILEKLDAAGALKVEKGVITFKVAGRQMGLKLSSTGPPSNPSHLWYEDVGPAWTTSSERKEKKPVALLSYEVGGKLVTGTPSYAKTKKTLYASVNSSIYSELVDTDEVKDVIFWLYSDSKDGAPETIDFGQWKFLDFDSFAPAKGYINGWDRATGQNIYVSANNYYLPNKDNIDGFPNIRKHNGTLNGGNGILIFDNANAGVNIQPGETSSPTNFYVCFVIVRFTLKNNQWTSQWLAEELEGVNKPQISQIMSAGVA